MIKKITICGTFLHASVFIMTKDATSSVLTEVTKVVLAS